MTNKATKKNKRQLQTTLGKAPCQNDKEIDLSHVRKPIHTSIFGLPQVLSLFQTATEEVQSYITNECDIMYECRICRTIFEVWQILFFTKGTIVENVTIPYPLCRQNNITLKNEDNKNRSGLASIIEKLKENQDIKQLTHDAVNEDLSVQNPSNEEIISKEKINSDLLLEKIATNNAAVFQTVLENMPAMNSGKSEYMKSEIMEIHGILDRDEAVLGPDGKICRFKSKPSENVPKNDLICTECNLKFSTKKTLSYHVKYKHNNTRLVYVCPDCKITLANPWCVYRHLYKIHRRTSAQIKRMREQIHNSVIRKDQEPTKKKDKSEVEKIDKTDEENQWLNNIEGDKDFQMCGGCGKRFERKAALHSHAQMCVKRIAVCNTIKENNAKRKEEETKDKNKINKIDKPSSSKILKGASKRKPYLLRTYKPPDVFIRNEDTCNEESRDICDVNANSEMRIPCDISSKVLTDNSLVNINEGEVTSLKQVDNSINKIDTEKMLNIMGLDSRFEVVEDSDFEQKVIKKTESDENYHETSQFDSFCQKFVQKLYETDTPQNVKSSQVILKESRDMQESEDYKKNRTQDHFKSTSSKKEKPYCKESMPQNETRVKEMCLSKGNTENVLEEDIQKTEFNSVGSSTSSQSCCKISIRSLAELLGISPKDYLPTEAVAVEKTNIIQNQFENKSVNFTHDSFIKNEIDQSSDTDSKNTFNQTQIDDLDLINISQTMKANISPKMLRKTKIIKPIKRKRTASLGILERRKYFKFPESEPPGNKEDINFIHKAAPYMDQSKLLCTPCQTTYPTFPKLLWHMSAHFSWFRFQCSRCSFISFSKSDCTAHARTNHNVGPSGISSVVLPIPNWKILLMSHEFHELEDCHDLSGKHTDEIMSGYNDEPILIDSDQEEEEDEVEFADSLFEDSENIEIVSDDTLHFPFPIMTELDCIKNESIDIIDKADDMFQIEVPQEIYSPDIFEVISITDSNDDRERTKIDCPTEIENDIDDPEKEYFIPKPKEQEVLVTQITEERSEKTQGLKEKQEFSSDNKSKEELEKCKKVQFSIELETNNKNQDSGNFGDVHNLKQDSSAFVNIRPTRNRTRSIKTFQNDFVYDLNKVIKLNDYSVSKTSSMQKQKKATCNATQKPKNSTSTNSKGLKVYGAKKK